MKILFIVAHPHYPACYMAGTVANHVSKGDEVYVVSMTKGEKVTDVYPEQKVADINVKEMEDAAKLMGIKEVRYMGEEDTSINITNELKLELSNQIREIKPDIIITHWKDDTHPDVRETAKLVEDCLFFALLTQGKWAKKYDAHAPNGVFAFDMPGHTQNFKPDYYVDVTNRVDEKYAAVKTLQLHLDVDTNGDLDKWMYPILTANARWAMNVAGGKCKYAEVYQRLWTYEKANEGIECLPNK